MTPTLTVVLPVHNAEASLGRNVRDVLELAGELTAGFQILIVDDGSTDETFLTAVELSRQYPQIDVVRHATRRGLGPTLRWVRTRVDSDVVVVHDGVSPIDANEIRQLWIDHRHPAAGNAAAPAEQVSIDDLRLSTATHAAMDRAHARLLGFQVVTGGAGRAASSELTRRDSPRQRGVGHIPPLPRPNFVGAVANFALGE